MYSRSYYPDTDISVPENYDGTAFSDDFMTSEPKTPKIEPVKNEVKFSPKEPECVSEESEDCFSPKKEKEHGSLFGIDFGGIFGGLFRGGKLSSIIPKDFGTEELLIIGIALFLLFSPDRDIECALLILALIFIK